MLEEYKRKGLIGNRSVSIPDDGTSEFTKFDPIESHAFSVLDDGLLEQTPTKSTGKSVKKTSTGKGVETLKTLSREPGPRSTELDGRILSSHEDRAKQAERNCRIVAETHRGFTKKDHADAAAITVGLQSEAHSELSEGGGSRSIGNSAYVVPDVESPEFEESTRKRREDLGGAGNVIGRLRDFVAKIKKPDKK
jgi:hypothetical protein